MSDKIFLDQAATSYPKPEEVYNSVDRFAREIGIGAGRGNYSETFKVAKMISNTRKLCSDLINANPENIVFTSGTTEALSAILLGGLQKGDHVLISPFEHNAVLRPLQYLAANRNVEFTVIEGSVKKGISAEAVAENIQANTKFCIINQISNAFGVEQPVNEIGKILEDEDIFFIVDAAQSMGTHEIDVKDSAIDALCFSGHKGLLGPTGTGGFYIGDNLNRITVPVKMGGTGRDAGGEQFSSELPYKYEVGTQNSWGLAGLNAGLKHIHQTGIKEIQDHIGGLTHLAVKLLTAVDSLDLFLPEEKIHHGVISFTTSYLTARDVASLLDSIFNIKVRAGLHCSPLAHKNAGSYPDGSVRISFGIMNTEDEIYKISEALKKLEDANVA